MLGSRTWTARKGSQVVSLRGSKRDDGDLAHAAGDHSEVQQDHSARLRVAAITGPVAQEEVRFMVEALYLLVFVRLVRSRWKPGDRDADQRDLEYDMARVLCLARADHAARAENLTRPFDTPTPSLWWPCSSP
jgi:hypothetical protein